MRFFRPELVAEWPKPNYINPETRGPALYIINGLFFTLATFAIVIRLYARIFVRRWFGLDDFLILLAWFFTAGDIATVFWGYRRYYWDHHMWDGKPEFLIPGSKTLFAAKLFWASSSSFIRLSILSFYYRLLEHVQIRKYRWVLHLVTFFVIAIYLCYLGTTIFACVPVEAYFFWPSPGTCIEELYADTILSAFNTFSELLIAALPIPVLFQLRMESGQRWAVISLLCLGALVAVVGSVRTYYVWILFTNDDLTWYTEPHWICSEAEICVATICACAPALRSFFGHLTNSLRTFPDTKRSSSTKHSISTLQSSSSRRNLDTKLSTYATQAELLLSRTVDLEGIALDGFGYTVTITGGDPTTKKRGARKSSRKKSGDVEKGEASWPMGRIVSRLNGGFVDESLKNPCIEIVTRRSLELRESFEESRQDRTIRGWDRFVL